MIKSTDVSFINEDTVRLKSSDDSGNTFAGKTLLCGKLSYNILCTTPWQCKMRLLK